LEDEGPVRVLICHESTNLSVRLTPGLTVSSAAARKAAPGTIFLDGAAKGGPFLDHERRVYNFDHHEDVIRAFTLATCEQTMMMLLKGLDLRENKWRLVANQPDLDTVLAIWVLLNHTRLTGKENKVRQALIPFLRLEGMIDGQGFEFVSFCGLPSDRQAQLMAHLKKLQAEEQRLRQTLVDEPEAELTFLHGMLKYIDRMLYQSADFEDFQPFEELAHVDLGEQKVAVACRSEAGIYELEQQIKRVYGTRLGLIALEKKPGTYTVRATALQVTGRMQAVYERLNSRDPNVSGRRPENRWGGATEIGGSPRETGSGLSPREVLETAREVFARPGVFFYAQHSLLAALTGILVMAVGWCAQRFWTSTSQGNATDALSQEQSSGFLLASLLLTALGVAWVLRKTKNPRRFGLALPTGWDWLLLFPVALLAGWGGGICSRSVLSEASWSMLCYLLLIPALMEILFRGLLMGLLAQGCLMQSVGGRWFLSWPVLGSAVLYTLFCGMPDGVLLGAKGLHSLEPAMLSRLGAGFAFGLAVGMIRERSESVGAAVLTHGAAALVVVNAAHWLG
jgi:hypothetical protein